MMNSETVAMEQRKVLFMDIDNCLYPKSANVHGHMTRLIDQYFMEHLNLNQEDASKLHKEYYKNYGLAIEGLVRIHKIDAAEYNRKVDDALPLESIIFPDPAVRQLFEDIDTTKVKLWLLTNAYTTHGKRVVRILKLDDLFEGMTYCDYNEETLVCKPFPEMFAKAMLEASIDKPEDCYFVDDSALNCAGAEKYKWNAVHLAEDGQPLPDEKPCRYQIHDLQKLRDLFPEFFNNKA